MSEDDTFRILKRIPFADIQQKLLNLRIPDYIEIHSSFDYVEEFLVSHGRSIADYTKELLK